MEQTDEKLESISFEQGMLSLLGVQAYTLGPWAWCISTEDKQTFQRLCPEQQFAKVAKKMQARYMRMGMSHSYIVTKPEEFVSLFFNGTVSIADLQKANVSDDSIMLTGITIPFIGDGPVMNLIVTH